MSSPRSIRLGFTRRVSFAHVGAPPVLVQGVDVHPVLDEHAAAEGDAVVVVGLPVAVLHPPPVFAAAVGRLGIVEDAGADAGQVVLYGFGPVEKDVFCAEADGVGGFMRAAPLGQAGDGRGAFVGEIGSGQVDVVPACGGLGAFVDLDEFVQFVRVTSAETVSLSLGNR